MSESQETQAIIAKRLQLMGKLIDRLEKITPEDLAELDPDDIVRLAVERIMTQVVDIAVSINQHLAAEHLGRGAQNYRESFEMVVEAGAIPAELAASLGPSTGMRNVLIHEYLKTDTNMLAAAVPMAITGYRDYIRSIARFIS